MNPNPDAPLAATLSLETERPTRLTVVVSDGVHLWPHTYDGYRTSHDQLVLGFYPNAEHAVEVTVSDETGVEWTYPGHLTGQTPPLPVAFPAIETTTRQLANMEPGVTLFSLREGLTDAGYAVIVDPDGDVVWYWHSPLAPIDLRRMSTGNLLLNVTGHRTILELDMLGNAVHEWRTEPDDSATLPSGVARLATPATHHEVYESATSFLTLSLEVQSVAGYPTSETDLTPRTELVNVGGDVVVEFARDGTILDQWSMLDMLDPTRVGYGSFGRLQTTALAEDCLDWSHGNAVIPDLRDDTFIVSLRHQDAVVKFNRNGEIVWILGPHENWVAPFQPYLLTPVAGVGGEPVDEWFWPYHQHAPMITPAGTILLFDNGWGRTSPPDPAPPRAEQFSRAVEYAVDDANLEIRQVWEYGTHLVDRIRSGSVGDADLLTDSDNVLVTFGWLGPTDDAAVAARLREVTHTTPANLVFELVVHNRSHVYRAERLPSLYP
jgi:arylsulfate sulfotransferase